MDRRTFLKTVGSGGILASMPMYSLAQTLRDPDLDLDITQFFDKWKFNHDQPVEFQLDYINPDIGVNSAYWARQNTHPDKVVDVDYVSVPLISSKFNVNDEALKTLFAAANDRNIVVFDSQASDFSIRLVSLLKSVSRRSSNNRKHITDIIVSKYTSSTPDEMYGCKIHRLSKRQTSLAREYIPSLDGNNFCLALADSRSECVIPVQGDRFGMAILSNQCVLLGKC